MPNYANTQLYELIEHDEDGNAHVYRGQTTGPLRKRLCEHRAGFKSWLEGHGKYVSSFNVLKHGPARIELVRVVSCLNKKEANREEGKFIRELPTCVNVQKNYENMKDWYDANREILIEKAKEYRKANKETINAQKKEYYKANKQTISAYHKKYRKANTETLKVKDKKYYETNKETLKVKNKKYREANKETISAAKKKYRDDHPDKEKQRHRKTMCECGHEVGWREVAYENSRHRNTWKHIHDFIHR